MDREKIEKGVRLILQGIGEDAGREGLVETPQRVARMYEEILSGMEVDPASLLKIFHVEKHDEMIIVRDIPAYSMCEHHMLPFIGHVHVAYVPKNGRITGLSKIIRVVDAICRRLQVQERLTSLIAQTLMNALEPSGVLVVMEAEHLCMSMRGVQKPGTLTITSAVRGIFKTRQKTRSEALNLIKMR